MKKFCLLHLSDLHIGNGQDIDQRLVRTELIKDVCDVVTSKNVTIDAVVCTGDTVDRGGSQEAFAEADVYYRSLMEKLGLPAQHLLIVPGNHDVPRREGVRLLVEQLKPVDFQDKHRSEEHWESLEPRFKSFNTLAAKFGNSDSIHVGMFGSSVIDLKTSSTHTRFLLLNSAWSTTGQRDYGNLLFGRWQLESLAEFCRNSSPPDLTIGLMHHPLDWFHKEEQELLRDYLGATHLLPVTALLHGHIHRGSVDAHWNPDSRLLSLVSGIGYPEADSRDRGRPKMSGCRYGVYEFSVDRKEMRVWLRVSRADGTFVSDTSLYKAGGQDGHFTVCYSQGTPSADSKQENYTPLEVDPVPVVAEYVGRRPEIETLLNPAIRAAAITGVGGQGKTALAAEFLRRCSGRPNNRFERGFWADCRELPDSLHVKVLQILEAISGGTETLALFRDEPLRETVKRFLRHLREHKLLIVLDNIDAYVDKETALPKGELKPLLDIILNNEHHSLVLLTSRHALDDFRGTFRQLRLRGLTPEEGVEFFKGRGLDLTGNNSERYCVQLVQQTEGHPWWLGLIAGQVVSRQDTLKGQVTRFAGGEAVTEYFKGIWQQLSKDRQRLLRYLVEAPRPLTDDEIWKVVKNDFGPEKVSQETRRLVKLGLLEPHERRGDGEKVYQVHPLAREFVHQYFPLKSQHHYVRHVLLVFLPQNIVDALFQSPGSLPLSGDSVDADPTFIVDSINTFFFSRNYDKALRLFERCHLRLLAEGYHHQFHALAGQILDRMDLNKVDPLEHLMLPVLLGTLVPVLTQKGDRRAKEYLGVLNSFRTAAPEFQVMYLLAASHVAWLEGRNDEAYALIQELEEWKDKATMVYLGDVVLDLRKALALRDMGRYEEALALLQTLSEQSRDSNTTALMLGNSGKCLLKLRRLEEADRLLCTSLLLMSTNTDYYTQTNRGYAYLWLAETVFFQGKDSDAVAFLTLATKAWSEYAAGLLHEIDTLKYDLFGDNPLGPVSVEKALEVERTYLARLRDSVRKTPPS